VPIASTLIEYFPQQDTFAARKVEKKATKAVKPKPAPAPPPETPPTPEQLRSRVRASLLRSA